MSTSISEFYPHKEEQITISHFHFDKDAYEKLEKRNTKKSLKQKDREIL